MPKPANLINKQLSECLATNTTTLIFDSVVHIMTVQDKIVSITPADLEVAYRLTFQCKMRSIHHLRFWMIFYFRSDV